mgnify:CR=1 FL=1|jgi:hypothetical protein
MDKKQYNRSSDMTEEIAVYKLQEWDMGNGEKKYS